MRLRHCPSVTIDCNSCVTRPSRASIIAVALLPVSYGRSIEIKLSHSQFLENGDGAARQGCYRFRVERSVTCSQQAEPPRARSRYGSRVKSPATREANSVDPLLSCMVDRLLPVCQH